jgi:hypothetical protein
MQKPDVGVSLYHPAKKDIIFPCILLNIHHHWQKQSFLSHSLPYKILPDLSIPS